MEAMISANGTPRARKPSAHLPDRVFQQGDVAFEQRRDDRIQIGTE
jgi:hypothetical protein